MHKTLEMNAGRNQRKSFAGIQYKAYCNSLDTESSNAMQRVNDALKAILDAYYIYIYIYRLLGECINSLHLHLISWVSESNGTF